VSTNWERRYVDRYCHRLMSVLCSLLQTTCVPYLVKERNGNSRRRLGCVYVLMWEYAKDDMFCVDNEMLLWGGVQSEAPKCVPVSAQTATSQDFPANNAA